MDKPRVTALRSVLAPGVMLLAMAFLAAPASATEAIEAFETTTSTTEAGGHPDLTTRFTLSEPGSPEAARNVIFNAPTGVFGNPNATVECTSADYALDQCPSNSQVGVTTIHADYKGDPDYLLGTAPIFALEPVGDQTARLAFIVPVLDVPINIPVAVRSSEDYGLRFTVSNITQLTPLAGAELTFWGFPALATHNPQRFPKGAPGEPAGCAEVSDTSCIDTPTRSSVGVHPFTDNPTTCTGEPLLTTLEVQTYQDPGHLSSKTASYPATTECKLEQFNPVLYANPTTDITDSPSGLDLELSDPQFLGLANSPSEIRAVNVTFPEGFTINPDAADGQHACSDDQANFDSEGPAECPNDAKIGTFSIGTKALNGRLEGALYIGEPQPGNQYRLFMIASGFGINAKLIGSFRPDLATGQLTAEFASLPQAPFDDFQMHLFSGERSLMATPATCSSYAVDAHFFPWNESLADQESTQSFALESGPRGTGCPGQIRPFKPELVAGASNPTAGAHSSFTLKLNREDGDQFLGKLNFTMPPGLTANLHGVTYCSEASITAAAAAPGKVEQASPSCPATSEIGTSNVAAGPGIHPFHAVGKIYLAGPFQGAPLSLVAITPALAGPYDYGTVVVRVALHVDPLDAHVIADSETVPEIIGGIPIRMREIKVSIDKPNFMINPTNCSPFSVGSEGIGDQGTGVGFSSPFQVVNCSTLPFKPVLKVTQLGGRRAARRGQDPSIRFDLQAREGDANINAITVTLPNALEIDQEHLGNLCAKSELETTHCAGKAPIGTVKDETPLLEQPLEGLAYAVSGYTGLPHVAFILNGQVTVIPRGESETIKGGRLSTTIPVVPDVPIGHFQLTLFGKGKGYLTNTRDLCASTTRTAISYRSQSGKEFKLAVPIKTPCGAARKGDKGHHRLR